MKSILCAAALVALTLNVGIAQTTPKHTTTTEAAPATTGVPSSSSTTPAAPPSDKAAASGNNNQAVATTGASADVPAKGANSFTMGEAQSRLEKSGYSHVSSLKKDDNGVWRGTAEKGGQPQQVWLDYKGNSGVSK